MSRWPLGLAAAAAAAGVAGVAGVAATRRRQPASAQQPDRWHTVTIDLPPGEVSPDGRSPAPLRDLGEGVEVELRPAPGGRGTELAARLRDGVPDGPLNGALARLGGDDPRQALRSALRQAKQLLETGEVLQADAPGSSRSTALNRPLQAATDRAGGEGRL